MYSFLTTVKKGIIAALCFAGPFLVAAAIKIVPALDSVTVGEVIQQIVERFLPGIFGMSIGSALLMIINWVKNK